MRLRTHERAVALVIQDGMDERLCGLDLERFARDRCPHGVSRRAWCAEVRRQLQPDTAAQEVDRAWLMARELGLDDLASACGVSVDALITWLRDGAEDDALRRRLREMWRARAASEKVSYSKHVEANMPIRCERAALYGERWAEISRAVRERAGQRCQWCAAPNGARIWRVEGAGVWSVDQKTWRDEKGQPCERPAGRISPTRVVLTVAHIDQDSTNHAEGNLAALCQRCHLGHDRTPGAKMRRAELEHGQEVLL